MAKAKKAVKKKVAKKNDAAKAKPKKAKVKAKKVAKKVIKKAVKKTVAKKPVKKTVAKKPAKKPVKKAAPKKAVVAKAPVIKPAPKETIPVLELEQYKVKPLIETGVKDAYFGSTRYAWIGSGQAGGRLVKAFYDLGYKKALAVNTTTHDLDLLELPKAQKYLMDIGEKGAGKEMGRGREAVMRTKQDILHLAIKTFGTEVDHVMVCFGAGGGTGGGSASELIDVAKTYIRSIGEAEPHKAVGAIMTLPTVGEAASPQVAQNAYKVAMELGRLASEGQISPLIIIDNEKISKMYPGLTVKAFWPTINNTVAGLFDVFNRLSALNSPYTTLDPVDYHSVLRSSGCAIMGLTKVDKYQDRYALSEAVRQNLTKTLLADGFNLASAKVAGCTMVGGKQMMGNTPNLQDNINFAFDVLAEITGKATIHRGIYEDTRESLRVYTILGGLDFPTARIEDLIAK
jgi:cell division GTPase FtsZ